MRKHINQQKKCRLERRRRSFDVPREMLYPQFRHPTRNYQSGTQIPISRSSRKVQNNRTCYQRILLAVNDGNNQEMGQRMHYVSTDEN
jgi:hypothetical protein